MKSLSCASLDGTREEPSRLRSEELPRRLSRSTVSTMIRIGVEAFLDVVAAREVLIEINEALARGLSERGETLENVFSGPERTRAALESMPSFDVAVTLKTAYHRDPMHRWTPNDIHDIDALGSTLPYCDVVVTDKAVASNVVRSKLTDRLGTGALWRLSDLPQHLC